MRRRTYLRTAAGLAAAGLLAGCAGDSDDGGNRGDGGGENEVAVGPGGDLTFEPETITVSTGDTVAWAFESNSHNVECDPEQSDYASLPDGADAFASYDGSNRFATDPQGTTFEHTFEVAGTYDYVCVPHERQGMRGTVVVEE